MNESRIWSVLTVVVIIVIVAGTWFLGVSPRLAEVATADSDRETVEDQNAIHLAKLKSLQELDANLPALEQELASLRAAVPQATMTSTLLRQLEAAAAAFGVSLSSTAFQEPKEFEALKPAPADKQLAGSMAALEGRGHWVLPLDVQVVGPRSAVLGFLNSLQTGERLMLVHGVNFPDGLIAPDSVVEATFTVQAFMLTGQAPVVETPAEAPVAEAAG
ncbi:hypothetical protein [Homoserinimonas hongtaonis]|uniref:Pilus assembly protein PilO n=1 Tax=Homoserinimonas hongtaonis TaxID=2079791 RepID=A0A2U1T0S2_9MICO|nr:hypothetical protein [Salinibacterium hongtaonis]PWB97470.1 hypothetical protein DF220_06215 [Salinibacterium hongtaonis]